MMLLLVNLSNSYVRAGIAAGTMFVLVFLKVLQIRGGDWASQHTTLIVLVLGFAMVITAVIVGTMSRKSEKPWPWLLIGAATLGCGLAVTYLMFFMQKFYLQ
jgi:hypothetical protein